MKTNKSFIKRLRVTKTGKILARMPGFNHFNAKLSRTDELSGRKLRPFKISKKLKSFLLPFN